MTWSQALSQNPSVFGNHLQKELNNSFCDKVIFLSSSYLQWEVMILSHCRTYSLETFLGGCLACWMLVDVLAAFQLLWTKLTLSLWCQLRHIEEWNFLCMYKLILAVLKREENKEEGTSESSRQIVRSRYNLRSQTLWRCLTPTWMERCLN